tara:strand:- start:268 stop:417 length:150 start_codon:yes stop_codon:yes gene_type:complete
MALPAEAKRGGVSSTKPVEPKPKMKIIIPEINIIKKVKTLVLDFKSIIY